MKYLSLLKYIGAVILLSFPLSLQARGCSSSEFDKAEYYADLIARNIVSSQYDGGSNVSVKVISCNFNSYSERFKIEIDTSFYSQLSGDYYNTQGIITMDGNGNNRKYSETYANSAAKDWKETRMVIGILGAIGALSE